MSVRTKAGRGNRWSRSCVICWTCIYIYYVNTYLDPLDITGYIVFDVHLFVRATVRRIRCGSPTVITVHVFILTGTTSSCTGSQGSHHLFSTCQFYLMRPVKTSSSWQGLKISRAIVTGIYTSKNSNWIEVK